MLGAIAGSMASSVGGLTQDAFNAWINYTASKKLMQKQYDLNMRAWNIQNEYNLPVNQMQRLADAGLNPHLVYGNGGASATAGTPSSVSQGSFRGMNADVLGDLASYQSIMNARAQEDLTKANRRYADVQAKQAELTGAKQRDLMNAQIKNLNSQSHLTNENAFTQEFVNTVPAVLKSSESFFNALGDHLGDWLYSRSGYRERNSSKWSQGALEAAGRLGRR